MASAILPFLPAIASAGTSFLSGILGKKGNEETPIQKQKRQLIDQMLASLNGEGPYSNLFQASEEDFNKSFREPALANFRNRTAPAIRGQYTGGAYGQLRSDSTGIEDSLTRAGVDMDQLLNKQYLNYVQGKEANARGAIGNILGADRGAPNEQSWLNAGSQGLSGYLSSPGFGNDLTSLLSSFSQKSGAPSQNSLMDTYQPQREGFEQEPQYYNWRTGVMG